MPQRRSDIAEEICRLAGNGIAQIVDANRGWPARMHILADGEWRDVAVFAAPVGLSFRNRDDVERRMQNPGGARPMLVPAGSVPLMVGLWAADEVVDVEHPVIVSANVMSRATNLTRYSLFPKLDSLRAAAHSGWAESLTTTGEQLLYFWPTLLDLAVSATLNGTPVPEGKIAMAAEAAGLPDEGESTQAVQRLRRVARLLIRDARFRRDVLTAYGSRCALCGLGTGLVEAAHIYPASAPDSPDIVSNGIALCRNHHGAFDNHLISVEPATLAVSLHPDLLTLAETDNAAAVFVRETRDRLARPEGDAAPSDEMLKRRYRLLAEHYVWTWAL